MSSTPSRPESPATPGGTATRTIWVGGYTSDMDGTAEGIGRIERSADGTLTYLGVAAVTASPSFLTELDGVIYAAGESGPTVSAFRAVPPSGTIGAPALDPLGAQPTADDYPCSVRVLPSSHPSGQALLIAACYGGGGLGVHRIGDDGAIAPLEQTLWSEGSGPHPAQEKPHAHDILQVDDTTVLTSDLGADRVWAHELRADAAEPLIRIAATVLPAGSGPRDLLRHPLGAIFVLAELSCEILVLVREGAGFVVASRTPLPGATAGDQAAALALSADGRLLYAGVRGSNRIAVLAVADDGASLQPVTSVDCGGDWPRHLVLDDNYLHVANQQSGSVATFRIGADGVPALLGSIAVPTPTYLLPAPR